MIDIDPRALRNAFGSFMTGVTVVTTLDKDKKPVGFTANSFTSVSLDPPLVLVCLANSSRNYETFSKSEGFAINILSEGQKDVSNTFAKPVDDRFASVNWKAGPFGSPVFDDVSAWFDCSTYQTVEAGDHLILIGKVEGFENSAAPGLGYARGAYVTPAAEAEALSQSTDLIVSALIEYDGRVLLGTSDDGHMTLPNTKCGKDGASAAVKRIIAQSGVNAEPGFIYSVYENDESEHQHICFLCQTTQSNPADGAFIELTDDTLSKVSDEAERTMLKRFAQESLLGNFGIYVGNQLSGTVRSISSKSE